MGKMIGYCVAGLGVGKNHVRGVLGSDHGKLIALCDLLSDKMDMVEKTVIAKDLEAHPEHKEHIADELLKYTDFDEMLKNPEIECVSIALPSGLHAKYAIKAMEAGKNVLIEKPMDITVEAAQSIIDAWKRTGVKVGVMHQNRNNLDMAPMKRAIDEGHIGKVFLGTFEVKWYREQSYFERDGGWRGTWSMDGGGSLMNQGVHTVDLMQWLMGDVESVTSTMAICGHDIETEDMTASLIKFKSGATATFVSTTCAYEAGCGTGIKVYGTDGTIECDQGEILTWKIHSNVKDREIAKAIESAEENAMKAKYSVGGSAASDPALSTGHGSVVNNLINAIYNNTDPMIVPTEGIKAVKIVNAIYESARTGKTVYLD